MEKTQNILVQNQSTNWRQNESKKFANISSYIHGQKSRDTCFSEAFSIKYTPVQPLTSPQRLTFVKGEGGARGGDDWERKRISKKDALFYERTERWRTNMNIALLSQGLLSIIVAFGFYSSRNKFSFQIDFE